MPRTEIETYRGFTIYALEDGTFLAQFGPVALLARSMPEVRKLVYKWWDSPTEV